MSPAGLDRLYESTAHDLVLLDNVLDTIEDTRELDAFDEETLFRHTLRRYFKSESVYAPELKRVAAVAQFDLALPLADLPRPIEPDFPKALDRLTVVMGRPSSLAFVHASAAELVFRALSWNDADDSWIEPVRRHLTGETLQRFQDAAVEAAADTPTDQDWPGVRHGIDILPMISPPLRDTLRAAADRFLDGVEVTDLSFTDFSPAVNAIACLWTERPPCRSELTARLWSVLPPPRNWSKDEKWLVAARFLLNVGRDAELPQDDAVGILHPFCPLPDRTNLSKNHTLTFFLFFWNLFALWFERGRDLATHFSELQPEELWTRLVDLIAERGTQRMRNEDKLNHLALAGLVAHLVPRHRSAVQAAVQGRIRGVSYLRGAAESLTFVPAFFALEGLSLLCPFEANFTQERCALLLEEADDYEERGPAIEYLCQEVRRRADAASGFRRPGRRRG